MVSERHFSAPLALARSVRPGFETRSVVAVFEDVVMRFPQSVALAHKGTLVTYSALDSKTNQVARGLQRLGVVPGDRIGVHAHRSLSTVIACLGILKAGACYVPLDPSFPAASLAAISADAELRLTLSSDVDQAAHLAPLVGLADALARSADEISSPLGIELSCETPAYIMFTSGSTSKPKGVLVPHRGIVRLVCDTNFAKFSAADTMLEVGPLAFDFSTLEIFGMLLNGGRLAILSDTVPSLAAIAAALVAEHATSMCLTPALFHLFVDHALDALAPLNQLFIGGDVISVPHIERFKARFPACRLFNGYGPTENTTFTTCYEIPTTSAHWGGGPVPIGPPISGTTVYLLDDDLRPVALGDGGTLWTGGAGVALGYLNRPEQTRERFRPDPFSVTPGALMYCTGDLAEMRPDGALSFLGRADRQIKIGGKRIELDAVETSLRLDTRIREAVAVMRVLPGDRREIVAFVEAAAKPSAADFAQSVLQQYAAHQPAYMVPARLIVVDAFPLSPTGKIDRKFVLQTWEAQQAAAAPRVPSTANAASLSSPIADEIDAIWRHVLGRDVIDPQANFFEIGGSSLRMIEVHAAVQKQLRPDIAIATLFRYASIASLAAHLESATPPQDALAAARLAGDRQKAALQRFRKPAGPTQ
jgi:amino acid adenylation domain-containing protein